MRRQTGQVTAVAAALALAAFGLVACGSDSGSGSDEDKIKDVLTTAVESNDGSICTDLFPTAIVEELTGETGDDAIKACEEDAENGDAGENVVVEDVEIDGDSATANVSFETDGEETSFGAELVKDGDDWKIDAAGDTGSGSDESETTSSDESDASDEDEIAAVIERAITDIDPSLCTEAFSINFVETATGETGDAAIKACEKSAGEAPSDPAESIEVSNITVDGDSATADVSYENDGEAFNESVSLVNEDGAWKIDRSETSQP